MTAAQAYEKRPDGVYKFGRDEFRRNRFEYKPGEHIVFGGPTQRGKTTLAFELLEVCASPTVPAYVAVSKPRDPTTEKYAKRYGFRIVRDWPAPVTVGQIFGDKPSGYVIWPKFGNIETDSAEASRITSALIRDRYTAGVKNKRGILFLDDTMVKARILGLDREMVTMLAMSGAMGIGVWAFVQKPTDAGRTAIWSYGASEHLFLARDPDARSRQRYDEIGGVDPKAVSQISQTLGPYEFLYIKRTEGYMCVIGAS